MDRRTFLVASAAALGTPALANAGANDVDPATVLKALDNGETVFVDFYTDWCTTCRAQQRALQALKSENPAYEQSISFYSLNWDKHKSSDFAKSLRIPRRSTLVVLKGDQELGRIVAGTSQAQIKGLMDAGLAAATA
ncbi:MAG: thioredoxin family protein [Pseudomonadota bacterium]